jgi:hypothetical protein
VWGRRDRVHEEVTSDMDGRALVRIQIEKVARDTREVEIKVTDRGLKQTVFEANYKSVKGEASSYYFAESIAKGYIEENDMVLDKILTNVSVGYVRTVNKRSR